MSRASKVILLCVVLAMAVVVTSACTASGEQQLGGTSWSLSGWSDSTANPSQFGITADFGQDTKVVSGNGGVNNYNAPYEQGSGGALTIGEIAATMMAGPDAQMKAENIYFGLLRTVKKSNRQGEKLSLLDANGKTVLEFTAQ